MRSTVVSLLLLCWVALVSALSASGSRLLVVYDEATGKDGFSKFWGDLESRGFTLTFETPKSNPSLFRHGARAYDHVLILPSKLKALGPALTPQLLLDFVKADGNILLALSASTPTPSTLSSLLLELDITLPAERQALVVDHFAYDTLSAAEAHDVLLLPAPKALRSDTKNYFSVPGLIAVPRAVGHTLGNASPLLAPILKAPATAYSYNPKDSSTEALEDLFAVGSQLGLISAMQARNSARFTLLGAAEMLEDTWFDADVQTVGGQGQKTANRAFAEKLSGWAFKESGVLKVGKLQHYLNEGVANLSAVAAVDMNPKLYRIKNDVTFSIELSEYTGTHYVPFTPAPGDTVQLEFTMLSPFHRLSLTPTHSTADSTFYSTSFTLPDQHGIFSFRVNYKRPFLTNIEEKHEVTVRHFAHDEWPRSWTISGAWPWIGGIGVTVVGWIAFCALWLWSAPTAVTRAAVGKKRQ